MEERKEERKKGKKEAGKENKKQNHLCLVLNNKKTRNKPKSGFPYLQPLLLDAHIFERVEQRQSVGKSPLNLLQRFPDALPVVQRLEIFGEIESDGGNGLNDVQQNWNHAHFSLFTSRTRLHESRIFSRGRFCKKRVLDERVSCARACSCVRVCACVCVRAWQFESVEPTIC